MYSGRRHPRLVGARQYFAFEPTMQSPFEGLGQLLPEELVDQVTTKLVAKIKPEFKQLVEEERTRILSGVRAGLPLAGLSILGLLATIFMVPSKPKAYKFLGYSGSALTFLLALFAATKATEISPSPPAKSV